MECAEDVAITLDASFANHLELESIEFVALAEKLRLRYCARPPFALDRIEELSDGRIAYRVKTVRKGKTHRVMSGPEFLARLAAPKPSHYPIGVSVLGQPTPFPSSRELAFLAWHATLMKIAPNYATLETRMEMTQI